MKTKFIDALESFLNARDLVFITARDRNTSRQEQRYADDSYIEASRKLEEAHKISLLDVIKDSEDATQ